MSAVIINANSAARWPIASGAVQMIATSPPYWGLREYGTAKWVGGDPACSHAPSDTPSKRGLDNSTLGGGKASTGHQQEAFAATCSNCGARREDLALGLERRPDCLGWATGLPCGECFICHTVQWAREAWRVLRDDGVMWVNIGDSYIGYKGENYGKNPENSKLQKKTTVPRSHEIGTPNTSGLKSKDICLIPQRLALALQADGWYVRQDIIWAKPNPMPESVTDRFTKAHEYIWLLSKRPRYFMDMEAVKEACEESSLARQRRGVSNNHKNANGAPGQTPHSMNEPREHDSEREVIATRNKRDVWNVATSGYAGTHFATWPPELVETMILAGSSDKACPTCGKCWERVVDHTKQVKTTTERTEEKKLAGLRTATGGTQVSPPFSTTLGFRPACTCYRVELGQPPDSYLGLPTIGSIVLDPFSGSGTTGRVALKNRRRYIGLELNPAYIALHGDRMTTQVEMGL